ncbi:unnamed protein product [Clonostachys chloroleuca]|uniref:Uncharacterized protein n=1 Tax=Clonostachys chloroleuca TaxID=1926264 RepID=A0AA35Q6W6_9HYPO|nr:unnamed protein product [Clonostachys chloroleuca]
MSAGSLREQQIHANDDETSVEFVARNVLTAAPHSDSVMVSLVSDMLRGNQDARAAWPSYGMAEDISAAASAIACPVLVVAIANDKVEPLERVQNFLTILDPWKVCCGISATFKDGIAVVALAIPDMVYLKDFHVTDIRVYNGTGRDTVADHVVQLLQSYERDNIATFIGFGIPSALLEPDIIPMVIPAESHHNRGPWESKLADEHAGRDNASEIGSEFAISRMDFELRKF